MKITAEEKNEIKRQFAITTTVQNIRDLLPENIFTFLHQNGDIATIVDRVNLFDSTNFKPYDSLFLVKFINSSYDIQKSISDLCYSIHANYLIFIDFHTLFLVKSGDDEMVYKLQRGSKFSHINSIIKIVTDNDIEKLVKEFDGLSHNDILNKVFQNHKSLYDFNDQSAYQPVAILSMILNIQLFPGR